MGCQTQRYRNPAMGVVSRNGKKWGCFTVGMLGLATQPTNSLVISTNAESHKGCLKTWIPAYAGMTAIYE
jgi:hypothetical protein